MDKKTIYLSILIILWYSQPVPARCPKPCTCSLKTGKKIVHCSRGGLPQIPVSEMDTNTHQLYITAPPELPNNITLGRIFFKFMNLETVSITHSGIPAIGDSSFWPGRRLKKLNLSHNAIGFLHESDFNGLKNLQELDLSDNDIFATPSAPFRHLINLKSLSLARNRLEGLVPRFFYLLTNLESLDLSGNPLAYIEPENLQDVAGLKILRIAKCQLTQVHPMIYQQLPFLEELDLRDNLIASLAPAEFRHLILLRILHLDGNLLSTIVEGTFYGHTLYRLGLSKNALTSLSECAFCNASVKILDLSFNKFVFMQRSTFDPLSDSLEVLNVSFNNIGNEAFSATLFPLQSLRTLQATNILVNELYSDIFINNVNLRYVNLSRNAISDLSPSFLIPLIDLEEIDLSENLLTSVSENVLKNLVNITTLFAFHLQGNPLDCSDCAIEPLIRWINTSHFLSSNSSSDYLRCRVPEDVAGKPLHMLMTEDMFDCQNLIYDRRFLEYTSRIGLIVAISIVVVIVCIIIVIIIIYRRHIAHYYTHEEERRTWKGIYDNPALAQSVSPYSDDKPTFIATPERVDENIDDFRRPSGILR